MGTADGAVRISPQILQGADKRTDTRASSAPRKNTNPLGSRTGCAKATSNHVRREAKSKPFQILGRLQHNSSSAACVGFVHGFTWSGLAGMEGSAPGLESGQVEKD